MKLYRELANLIASEITERGLGYGDRLPTERDLASKFGVSRPTVREALIALELMGVIEPTQGVGIIVTGQKMRLPQANFLEVSQCDLIEARRLVGGEIAALAAAVAKAEEVRQLQAICDDPVPNEFDRVYVIDHKIHHFLGQIVKNGALSAQISLLWDVPNSASISHHPYASSVRVEDVRSMYRSVVEMIGQGNPKGARLAYHRAIEQILDHLLEQNEIREVDNAMKRAAERRNAFKQKFNGLC